MTKLCRKCGSPDHTGFHCKLGRKPLKTTTTLKPRKPMNKIGKVGKATNAAVAKWKRIQKPSHEGYWICYICQKWIPYLTAEHMNSKNHRPDQRTDADNLSPVCNECNEKKSSLDIDQYLAKLQKLKEAQNGQTKPDSTYQTDQ